MPSLQTANDSFAHAVERVVVVGVLMLDLFLAEAGDEVEQLGIGTRQRQPKRSARDGDAVGRLIEGDAEAEPLFIFGNVLRLLMDQADGDGAPARADQALDTPHEAHQREIGNLRHIRHGDRIGPFDAAGPRAVDKLEAVGGEHAVIARERLDRGAQVRRVGQHIAERVAGQTRRRAIFQAEARIAGGLRGERKGEREPIEQTPRRNRLRRPRR